MPTRVPQKLGERSIGLVMYPLYLAVIIDTVSTNSRTAVKVLGLSIKLRIIKVDALPHIAIDKREIFKII